MRFRPSRYSVPPGGLRALSRSPLVKDPASWAKVQRSVECAIRKAKKEKDFAKVQRLERILAQVKLKRRHATKRGF